MVSKMNQPRDNHAVSAVNFDDVCIKGIFRVNQLLNNDLFEYLKILVCEDGWTYFARNELCYKLVDIITSWTDARSSCETSTSNPSANLASVPDSFTNAFLADLKTAAYSAWIGGYKDLENNIWGLWTDGTPWGYTNWGPLQPSDTLGEEDFLVMQGTGTIWTNGQWNDGLVGAYPQRSLCQYNPKGDCYKFLTFQLR